MFFVIGLDVFALRFHARSFTVRSLTHLSFRTRAFPLPHIERVKFSIFRLRFIFCSFHFFFSILKTCNILDELNAFTVKKSLEKSYFQLLFRHHRIMYSRQFALLKCEEKH